MPDKSFPSAVPFFHATTPTGEHIWLPLVTVTLVQANGSRVDLPLIFDTGASVTTLRHDMHHLLGVPSWDSGQPVSTGTAGGLVTVYQYQATLEFLGKAVTCPVQLNNQLPAHPLWVGLFGRATIFEHFGFGFWENTHELLVTTTP